MEETRVVGEFWGERLYERSLGEDDLACMRAIANQPE